MDVIRIELSEVIDLKYEVFALRPTIEPRNCP